jgi:hypothetical protein
MRTPPASRWGEGNWQSHRDPPPPRPHEPVRLSGIRDGRIREQSNDYRCIRGVCRFPSPEPLREAHPARSRAADGGGMA